MVQLQHLTLVVCRTLPLEESRVESRMMGRDLDLGSISISVGVFSNSRELC